MDIHALRQLRLNSHERGSWMKRKIPRELTFVGLLFVWGIAEFSKSLLAATFQGWFPALSAGLTDFLASIPGILIGTVILLIFFIYWEKRRRS